MPIGKHVSEEAKQKIVKLKAQGLTSKIIAIRMGLSENTINIILRKMRTEKQFQEHREYMRVWRKEHPEKVANGQRRFMKLHPGYNAKYAKKYKQLYPETHKEESRILKKRHNDETLLFATRSHARWEGDEIDYLTRHALTMTARQIAFNLERSYSAVIIRAFRFHIPMMTEDKRHRRLVTH